MITEYIDAALSRAKYEIIDDEEPYYGEVPELEGVWATGKTLEQCRHNLAEVIDGWLVVRLKKGMPEKSISLPDVARSSISLAGDGPITGRGSVEMPQSVPMFAVQVAGVELDKETGKVKILSYSAAQDVGLAINPTLVEGQMQGAIYQGIRWAVTEDYVFHEGVMQNATLLDYRRPTAGDLPFMETLLVEVSSATGPFGICGVGEPSIILSLSTIANAIHSATGVRLIEFPMTAEAVFWDLRTRDKSGGGDKP